MPLTDVIVGVPQGFENSEGLARGKILRVEHLLQLNVVDAKGRKQCVLLHKSFFINLY